MTGVAEILWVAIAFLCLVSGYLAGRADERRKLRAVGQALNRFGALVNIQRHQHESEARLRLRVMEVMRPDQSRARERFVGESTSAYEARRKGGFR